MVVLEILPPSTIVINILGDVASLFRRERAHLPVALNALRWSLLVGVVLVLATIMLIVHAFGVLTSLVLGPLFVNPVGASRFGETINFSACEASEHLFRELMTHRLAYYYFSYGCVG